MLITDLLRPIICLLTVSILLPFEADAGIAEEYPGDTGIEIDSRVLFAENFESGLDTLLSRFTGYADSAFTFSSDRPLDSAGTTSLLIHPKGGSLFRLLPTEYDQLYIRYYIKYLGFDYHHSGIYAGGYWPRSSTPLGDAGLKGIRPDGSRLIHIGLEPQGWSKRNTDSARLDTYVAWIDMPGQKIGGGWWGRNFVRDLRIPVRPGIWQCIELMIKLNSSATAHDGELAIWIDGVLLAHFKPGFPSGQFHPYSGDWEMYPAGPGFPGLQWRDMTDYGLNWIKIQNYDDVGAPTDLLVDDLVVATDYVGPITK